MKTKIQDKPPKAQNVFTRKIAKELILSKTDYSPGLEAYMQDGGPLKAIHDINQLEWYSEDFDPGKLIIVIGINPPNELEELIDNVFRHIPKYERRMVGLLYFQRIKKWNLELYGQKTAKSVADIITKLAKKYHANLTMKLKTKNPGRFEGYSYFSPDGGYSFN